MTLFVTSRQPYFKCQLITSSKTRLLRQFMCKTLIGFGVSSVLRNKEAGNIEILRNEYFSFLMGGGLGWGGGRASFINV